MSVESNLGIGASAVAILTAIGSGLGLAYGFGKNKERINGGMTALSLQIEGMREDLAEHRQEATKRADMADRARFETTKYLIDEIRPIKEALGVAQSDIARLQGADEERRLANNGHSPERRDAG
jgi:uncharacterized protein HemX